MKNIFHQKTFLEIYDLILPQTEFYAEILKIHREKMNHHRNVADLACGTGNLTILYLEDGKNVTAIDISDESITRLSKKVENTKLTLHTGDITNLDFISNNTFDGASSMIAAHLIDNYTKHIEEAYRIIKPSGKFIITARALNGNPENIVEIIKESLIASNQYDKLEKEFIILRDNLLRTTNKKSKSLYTAGEAAIFLKNAGFMNIKSYNNKSKGVMYTLVGEK